MYRPDYPVQGEAAVQEKLPRKHRTDPAQRRKDELQVLREDRQLKPVLEIPDAAAPVEIAAAIARRTIDIGMTLRAQRQSFIQGTC